MSENKASSKAQEAELLRLNDLTRNIVVDSVLSKQHEVSQPDYMSWSIGSLFLCVVWGIAAFRASNKVRRFNEVHNYNEAARFSRIAYRHNLSAVSCFIVMIVILGLPWAIALAVQGNINNYPSAREFFGK